MVSEWFKYPLKNRTCKILFIGFLLVVVQLVFAGYSVISVMYVKGKNDPWLIIMLRVLIATPISAMMAFYTEGSFSIFYRDYKTMLFVIICGLTSTALNSIMYLQVIIYTSGSYVSILAQLIPIFSSIFSLIFRLEPCPNFKDKATICRFFGIVGGISFAIAISIIPLLGSSWNKDSKSWTIGTFIGLVNNLIFSLYLVLQMKLFYTNPNSPLQKKPFTINFLCTFYGTVLYSFIFFTYFGLHHKSMLIDKYIVIPAVYAGFLNVAIGFGLLTFCIKHSSAIISSCLFSMQIATSLILLRLFTNEKLTTVQYILCPFLILSGISVVLSPLLKKPQHSIDMNNKVSYDNA